MASTEQENAAADGRILYSMLLLLWQRPTSYADPATTQLTCLQPAVVAQQTNCRSTDPNIHIDLPTKFVFSNELFFNVPSIETSDIKV
jgi:hypothetical protein